MIRDTAIKTNDFCVKDLGNSGAIVCNLCLELVHFALQPPQARYIQHFTKSVLSLILQKCLPRV